MEIFKMKNKKTMTNRIANMQLGTKIVGIILIVMLLMISSSIAGISMVLNSSNRLLYQALAGSKCIFPFAHV